MKKNKKKKIAKKATLLSGAAKSLKKLGKGSVGRLSTTQKVLAGTAIGALGVRYLVKKLSKPKTTTAATDYASAGASNDTFGTTTDE